MQITHADRMKMLEEIKESNGISERDDDEFTIKEIAESFEIDSVNAVAFLNRKNIKYERRKAVANGRSVYVYKFIR